MTITGLLSASEILVPLTNSLYCRGRLPSTSKVLVDIGTGFYVEKVRAMIYEAVFGEPSSNSYQETPSARAFYEDKISSLGKNLRDLENIIQQKIDTAQTVDTGKMTSLKRD